MDFGEGVRIAAARDLARYCIWHLQPILYFHIFGALVSEILAVLQTIV